MSEPITVIPPEAFVESDPTVGMRRQRAIDVPGLWSGIVHTDPGATSGWHHHGEHETRVATAIIARAGSGAPTVNVEGPDALSPGA